MTLRTQTTATKSSRRPNDVIDRFKDWWSWCILGIVVFPAMLATKPGWISADTKIYLYLDPWRLLVGAQSMWNPNIDMGTVTHENMGYLFPMGPFYWLVQSVGMPMWVGQRIWTSALFIIAGGGVLYLGRILGLSPLGRLTAAMLYMLSPFVFDYMGRSSVLLMPWTGFAWMVAFTVLAARRGGWKYPALFAFIVAAVGGINATAIIFVGFGPLLWLLYVGFLKEASWKAVWRAAWRIALLSFLVSLWWISGLWAEAAYGLNILRYTETIPTVVMTSSPSEVFRGLGYWYLYGWDRIQPWVLTASQYIAHVFPILISFAIPAAALAGGFLVRWRYRFFAILLVGVGLVLAVSAFPLNLPTPFGSIMKMADQTTVGLAMRSSNRAIPVMLLGLALLLGSGVTSLVAKRFWVGVGASVVVLILILVNLAPFFEGQLVASNLAYPTPLPKYVTQTADYLNVSSPSTRVLGIPGVGFGYYNWGVSMDQIWPGLLDRGWISRGAVPQGEAASVNLLRALDESMQDGVMDPASVAPMASLMSAGDVLYQGNLQSVRFNGIRQMTLWNQLQPTPQGLGTPKTFGPIVGENTLIGDINDQQQLDLPNQQTPVPSLAVFPVANPRAVIRTEPMQRPLIVAGDGEGLLETASFNLFGSKTPIFYSASFPTSKSLAVVSPPGSTLVVTDSNAKRLDTWGTLDSTYGYVQTANEKLFVPNPSEQPSSIFTDTNSSSQTVAVLQGVKSVQATSYGNPISNSPEDQPFNAIDGNLSTAWTEGALEPATNQTLQITLLHPVTTDHIVLLQPHGHEINRSITSVKLTFNGKNATKVKLTDRSLTSPGQEVMFPTKTFQTLDVTVTGVTGSTIRLANLSGVGFAEVRIGNVPPATEWLRPPTDLLDKVGTASASHNLVLLLHRLRSSGIGVASDTQPKLLRLVSIPTQRSFSLQGESRINPLVSDSTLNEILGRTTSTMYPSGSSGLVPIVQSDSSSRLGGDLSASSWAAEDKNSSTAWQSDFKTPEGQWLEFSLASPITFSNLNLKIVTDGRHDVPTQVTVSAGGVNRVVTLATINLGKGRPQGSVTSVPITFPALTGSTVRLTIDSTLSLSQAQITLDGGQPPPVGIAEMGIPGVVEPQTPANVPSTCLSNLLSVNGHGVPLELTGTSADALNRKAMTIVPCSTSQSLTAFQTGSNAIVSADGTVVGWDMDLLDFSSAGTSSSKATPVSTTPMVSVHGSTQWTTDTTVKGTGSASWLVLGQSESKGWQATLNGKSLGAPVLIDGYANGWKLPAIARGTVETVRFEWAPQHVINIAEILSLLSFLIVLLLAFWPTRRKGLIPRFRDDQPTWTAPWSYEGEARSWKTTVIVSIVVGLIVGFFTAPLTGLVSLILCVLALRFRHTRVLLFLGSTIALLLAGLVTAYLQHKYIFPWALGWPDNFGTANTCAWISLALLFVDGVADVFRERLRGADIGENAPDNAPNPVS